MSQGYAKVTWSYVTGGTLAPDAPSYVGRQADQDLFESLRACETCYVLNSRQMGKSSLCVRTILRLKEAGIRSAFCDLTKFGGRNLTAEQWYAALLSEIGRELGMRSEFLNHWKANVELPPVQRLFGAIAELAPLKGPVVIFFDEIDVTLSLPFSADEFFAAIRQCYVGRATDESLKNLSFCLLGTATPADLIKDTRVSPFNIGKRIELQDFTESEARPLAAGLGSEELLSQVLYWTAGHPYLTQRLCQAVQNAKSKTRQEVDQVCSDLFLTHKAKESDDNLAFVRNRLLRSEADLPALLDLYRQMRAGKPVQDDETNPLCAVLKLSGVAKVESGQLKVRNRIYEHVFDQNWVEDHLPDAEKRRQREAYRRGVLRTLAASIAAVLILAGLAVYGFVLASKARIAEEREHQLSEESERNLYFADMNAIPMAYQRNDFDRIDAYLTETKNSRYRGFEWGYWMRLAHPEIATIRIESDIAVARFSPDGSKILVGCTSGLAAILDAKTRAIEKLLRGHREDRITGTKAWFVSGVTDCCWSRDSRQVITAGADGTAIAWDATTGVKLHVLTGHLNPLTACTYCINDTRILTQDIGETRLWDARTGALLRKLFVGKRIYDRVSISPADSRLLLYAAGREVVESNLETGKERKITAAPSGGVVCYSLDGTRIALCGDDHLLMVKDVASGKLIVSTRCPSETSVLCFSPGGKRIVTSDWKNVVTLWDTATGSMLRDLRGHSRPVEFASYSPNGKWLLTSSDDGTAKLWDVTEDLTVPSVPKYSDFLQFSSDGSRLLIRSLMKTIELEVPSLKQTRNPHLRKANTVKYHVEGYSGPEGNLVFRRDAGLRVGDPDEGKLLALGLGRNDWIDGISTNNNLLVAVVWAENKLSKPTLWDIRRHTQVPLQGRLSFFHRASISPNGRSVAAIVDEHLVDIWDSATGRVRLQLRNSSFFISIAFAPDSSVVLTGGDDGAVRLWDLKSGRVLRVFDRVAAPVINLAVTADRRRVVGSLGTGGLIMWDFDTGKEALRLDQNSGRFLALACSLDCTYVAAIDQITGAVQLLTSRPRAGTSSK